MKLQVKIDGNTINLSQHQNINGLSTENNVRKTYVDRLIKHYGFSNEQMAEGLKAIKSKTETAFADIIIWRSKKEKENGNTPLIVVECKAQQVAIRKEDYFKGAAFAAMVGATFFVTANQKQAKVFSKIFKVDKKGRSFNLEEVLNIPKADKVYDEKEINALLKQTIDFARDDFSRLLFRCHNIIRNNDKLSPEAAFDEISKVLFIKTLYERKNEKGLIFLLEDYKNDKRHWDKVKNEDDLPYYRKLFDNVKKELKNDDLFEPNETIKIRENSFEAIVKELEIYNLSTTSDDVKGIAFEQFLGRTFRGELGQFFTPRSIVDYMVEILDPQEGETICDPCCGSGGFLIKAFEYVRVKIEANIQEAKEKIKQKYYTDKLSKLSEREQDNTDRIVNEQFSLLNKELDINNPESRLHRLSFDCIFGTDANPRMARTAKMNMIMHGDGHGGVHHHDGLLNINGIFDGRFDVILTNPPFGARVEKSLKITEQDKYTDYNRIAKYTERYGKDYTEALKQINDNIGKSVLSLFETGEMSSLTEVLFIERCLNLLRPGGRMAIVLPEGVLNNTNLQKVRDFVEGRAKIINITSIPQDVFIASGATVKPSLLFFKKFTDEEAKKYHKIEEAATKASNDKHKSELEELHKKLKANGINKEEKRELREKQKEILLQIEEEIKADIKTKFDYEIPIVEVDKAGISTTGAPIENELEPVAKEFKKYRIKNRLWKDRFVRVEYDVFDGMFQRVIAEGEPEVFYGKNGINN